MVRSKLAALALGSILLGACGRAPSPAFTAPPGARAISRDDAFLYVVDTDRERLKIVNSDSQNVVAEVAVGRAPERVAVGSDETIYVTNRGSRSVSVIRKGAWREAARIPAGIEPLALTVSRDGSTLYVVNGSSELESEMGTLTAVDTRSLRIKWDLPVGAGPRDITLLENGDALISLRVRGEAIRVDLSHPGAPRVVGRASPVHHAAL